MAGQAGPMVGTCGFPIRRESYFRQLDTVELQTTFLKVPKVETAERMREQAPGGFDFTIKAWQGITHPATSPSYARAGLRVTPRKASRYGRFQMSKELVGGWELLSAFADGLDASVILFQTPQSFDPTEENISNLRTFLGMASEEHRCAWEPRGWSAGDVTTALEGLDVIHAVDPFVRDPVTEGEVYFRLSGSPPGERSYYYNFTKDDTASLAGSLEGRAGHVLFGNITMLEDAERLAEMVQG